MITTFDSETFETGAKEALKASSTYIRDAILGEVELKEFLTKEDKTAVTIVDYESQRLALPILRKFFQNCSLNPEEEEASGNDNASIKIYFDPLDGTGGFLIGGPTPTVILAAYDQEQKRVLACATMEPTTGRLFISIANKGAYVERFDYESKVWTEKRRMSVNNAQFKQELPAHVLVDVTHPFMRGGSRQILTKKGRRYLTNGIEDHGAKEASFYTNGGHYALTALGRPTIIGNITTAIGGPFDIAGVCHVLEAGGAIECYEISNKKLKRRGEDIETADLVIAANNRKNLVTLENILIKATAQ